MIVPGLPDGGRAGIRRTCRAKVGRRRCLSSDHGRSHHDDWLADVIRERWRSIERQASRTVPIFRCTPRRMQTEGMASFGYAGASSPAVRSIDSRTLRPRWPMRQHKSRSKSDVVQIVSRWMRPRAVERDARSRSGRRPRRSRPFWSRRLGCECVAAVLEAVAGLVLDQVQRAVLSHQVGSLARIGFRSPRVQRACEPIQDRARTGIDLSGRPGVIRSVLATIGSVRLGTMGRSLVARVNGRCRRG